MRIPLVLAVSLVAVLAGSIFLAGPFSVSRIIPKQDSAQQAEAAALPLVIRDRFAQKEVAGDAASGSRFLKVDENFVDPENHCEFCTRVEYTPGPQGMAGFSYEDLKGLDLSNAKKARFWVMGEEGDEKIKFKLAGKSLDKMQDKLGNLSGKLTKSLFKNERFALTTEQVTLDDKWKKYEVDLSGVDLKDITHPFAFELAGNSGQKQVLFLKGVVYDDQPAVDALTTTAEELVEPLAAEIISNATEGAAPATFEFEANVVGGTEPHSIVWDFDDGEEGEGQDVAHTFAEAGEYNVTLVASDAQGQSASDNVVIQVQEPQVVEDETVDENDALTGTNSAGSVEQQPTNESGAEE